MPRERRVVDSLPSICHAPPGVPPRDHLPPITNNPKLLAHRPPETVRPRFQQHLKRLGGIVRGQQRSGNGLEGSEGVVGFELVVEARDGRDRYGHEGIRERIESGRLA